MPEAPDRAALAAMAERCDEAKAAILRLVAGAFRRDGERLEFDRRPRFSIPCRPEHDDDMVAVRLVEDCAAALRALAEPRP